MVFTDLLPSWLAPELEWYLDNLQAGAFRPRNVLVTLAVMFAFWLVARYRSQTPDSRAGILSFMFPKSIYWHESARVTYKFFLLDPFVRRLLFGPATAIPVAILVFQLVHDQLRLGLGPPGYQLSYHETHPLLFATVFALVSALVGDLAYYCQHSLMHRVPFLWEFHKVHHSAKVLTPVTDWQQHPLDLSGIGYFKGAFMGVFQACAGYFFVPDFGLNDVLGPNVVVGLYFAVAYNLRHSHIWMSFGWWVNHVLMSPAQHQIHHSTANQHLNKNFGSVFTFWDWVFGTLYIPAGKEDLEYGLGDGEEAEYLSVWNLYVLPFKKNAQAGRTWMVAALIALLLFGFAKTMTSVLSLRGQSARVTAGEY